MYIPYVSLHIYTVHLLVYFSINATWLPTRLCCCFKGIRHVFDLCHDLLPGFGHLKKHLGLGRQLPLDVRGQEDTLEEKPVPLACKPLILARREDRGKKKQRGREDSGKNVSGRRIKEVKLLEFILHLV